MTVNEYQEAAFRTANTKFEVMKCDPKIIYPLLIDGMMGLNGEAGECIDILKKHIYQGHDLDVEHIVSELGDVAWYLAICAKALGVELETVFQKNIDKLWARYPNGFEEDRSRNRPEEDV